MVIRTLILVRVEHQNTNTGSPGADLAAKSLDRATFTWQSE
ncbi:hypothetical protein ABIA35_006601 [Catenulispora sp. MAP12-49]